MRRQQWTQLLEVAGAAAELDEGGGGAGEDEVRLCLPVGPFEAAAADVEPVLFAVEVEAEQQVSTCCTRPSTGSVRRGSPNRASWRSTGPTRLPAVLSA